MAKAKTSCDPDFSSCDISLFGGLITGLSSNYSWGQSGASLSISVIEQPACEDEETAITFCPPKLGYPVCLDLSCEDNSQDLSVHDEYMGDLGEFITTGQVGSSTSKPTSGWRYIGLLDSWDETVDATSGKRFEVRLTDPVQIVDGYQIILDGYDGQTFGVRNLCNLKGFLLSENGPNIMKRTIDKCGCTIPRGGLNDLKDPDQDLIYPSEFLQQDSSSGDDVNGKLETRDILYNKLGLKWHLDVGEYDNRPKISFKHDLTTEEAITNHIHKEKYWDASEDNGGGVPAVLVYESLKALTTGKITNHSVNVDRWDNIQWDKLEDIRNWRRTLTPPEKLKGLPTGPIWEYWQPPKWRDHFYLLDLQELEDILYNPLGTGSLSPDDYFNYRINSDKISLLEFVDKVCKDHGYDWQFVLQVNESVNPNRPCARYQGSGCEDSNGNQSPNCLNSDNFDCWYFDPYPNLLSAPCTAVNDIGGGCGSGLTIKLRVYKVNEDDPDSLKLAEGNAWQDCINAHEEVAPNNTRCPDLKLGELGKAPNAAKTSILGAQRGLEHSKEPKNSFIIGDKVHTIHQIIYKETDNPQEATIWPYWGQIPIDSDAIEANCPGDNENALVSTRPIAGKGVGDLHYFDVDSTDWGINASTYRVTVMELQHALISQDAWMNFYGFATSIEALGNFQSPFFQGKAAIHNSLQFPDGFYIDTLREYARESDGQQIRNLAGNDFVDGLMEAVDVVVPPLAAKSPPKEQAKSQAKHTLNLGFDWENPNQQVDDVKKAKAKREALYNKIKAIADEHFGRKYIVPLPFVCGYMQGEKLTDNAVPTEHFFGTQTNWEPAESGWTEQESVIGLNRTRHNKPVERDQNGNITKDLGTSFFETDDGRLECFVRFNCFEKLDLSKINREDMVLGDATDANKADSRPVYIRAEVERLVRSVDDVSSQVNDCSGCDTIDDIKALMDYNFKKEQGDGLNSRQGKETIKSKYSTNPVIPPAAGPAPHPFIEDDDHDHDSQISCFPTYSHEDIKFRDSGYLKNEDEATRIVEKIPTTFGFGYSAVVTLSGPVLSLDNSKDQSLGYFLNTLTAFFHAEDQDIHKKDTLNQLSLILKAKAGLDAHVSSPTQGFFVPSAIALPLKSNLHAYGPYYSERVPHEYPFGAPSPHDQLSTQEHLGGKTEVIIDQSLSPWNYGSVARMHKAGDVMAKSSRTRNFAAEQGQLTALGLPEAHLGDYLGMLVNKDASIKTGPVITDIRVSQSPDQGIRTTYGFKTYYKRFGTIEKIRISQLQRINSSRMEQLKRIRDEAIAGGTITGTTFTRIRERLKRTANAVDTKYKDNLKAASGNTSHHFIYGDAHDGFGGIPPSSASIPNGILTYNSLMDGTFFEDALPALRADDDGIYEKKAGVEHKGLFRPFSTKTDHTHISHYQDGVVSTHDATPDPIDETDTSDPAKINNFFSPEQVPPVDNEYNMPITVQTLNPFKTDKDGDEMFGFKWMNTTAHTDASKGKTDNGASKYHDIDFVVRGNAFPVNMSVRTEYDKAGSISHDSNYRAISLRGPLILTGWGYDINNDPVPSQKADDGNSDQKDHCKRFLHDWMRKPHTWKTGPVDLRWDESRGVWTAPSTMKLVQVDLCECLNAAHGSKALGVLVDEEKQKQLDSNNEECEDVDKNTPDCGDDTPCGEDSTSTAKDVQTVTVFNASGKIVTIGTKVMAYYDTVKRKYFVITAPEPLFVGQMVKVTSSSSPGRVAEKVMLPGASGKCQIISSFDEAGIKNCEGDPAVVEIKNTLKQPICLGKHVFVRLTSCFTKSSSSAPGEPDYIGEVLQAEFDDLVVVTSVDCYEDEYHNATLEICDRLIYLQSAWSIEDCGKDSQAARADTKGWNPNSPNDEGTSITPNHQNYFDCGTSPYTGP